MSRKNRTGPKLELKLNLSPPRENYSSDPGMVTPSRSEMASPTSSPPASSCISSEEESVVRYSSSPEATSMVVIGCQRCLMYVMLAEEDVPKCPKCHSTVLLHVFHDNSTTNKTANT